VNLAATAASAELRDFVESVRRLCAAELGAPPPSREERVLSRGLWRRLGELGVLGLGEADGEASWMVAAYQELGAALCPGPLAATAMASRLLSASAPEELAALRSGDRVVAVGAGGVFPWGVDADLLIGTAGDAAWLVAPDAPRSAMHTLGREPWARVDPWPVRALSGGRRAAAVGDLAVSALLLGAAGRLVEMSAEHARTRQQFGRAIGSFQAVSFPLAAGYAALHNAGCLADSAAQAIDASHDARALCAGARTVAAAAALEVARVAHQVHGASGFTEESPVGAYSAHIRQWTLLPPSPAAGRAALLAGIGADADGAPHFDADRAPARGLDGITESKQ
jgi:alkylation response protein AidB-like acyl-CoA dehydrogenase